MTTLPFIINNLRPFICFCSPFANNFDEIKGIMLVDDETKFDDSMIYIGTAGQISKILESDQIPSGCVIISAGDDEELSSKIKNDIILITTSLSLGRLHNILMQSILYFEKYYYLFQKSAEKGIRSLLKTVSSNFNGSIWLLSSTLHPFLYDASRENEQIIDEKLFNDTESPFFKLINHPEYDNKYTTAISADEKGGFLGIIQLIINKTVSGYLLMSGRESAKSLENNLHILAPIVAELIFSHNSEIKNDNPFQTLAEHLINEEPKEFDTLEIELRQIPKQPEQYMRGIVIRILDDNGTPLSVHKKEFEQLYQEIQNMFFIYNTAILNDAIYILISDKVSDFPVKIQEREDFNALLKKFNAYAIISNPSRRLRGVRIMYYQCFNTLPIAVAVRYDRDDNKRCIRFEHYSQYNIIRLCEKTAYKEMGINDLLFLCHPDIIELTRYDRDHGSHLRDTLYTFLMNDRNIAETSKKLFLHRNTVIYRLNKIQEIVHNDLDDSNTRHQLILSCMIIKYIEKYLHTSFNLPSLETSLRIK